MKIYAIRNKIDNRYFCSPQKIDKFDNEYTYWVEGSSNLVWTFTPRMAEKASRSKSIWKTIFHYVFEYPRAIILEPIKHSGGMYGAYYTPVKKDGLSGVFANAMMDAANNNIDVVKDFCYWSMTTPGASEFWLDATCRIIDLIEIVEIDLFTGNQVAMPTERFCIRKVQKAYQAYNNGKVISPVVAPVLSNVVNP